MKDELLVLLRALYGLTEPIFFEQIRDGFLSRNYRIQTTSETYFLKEYRAELKTSDVKSIHVAKSFFFNGGVSAVLPLDTTNGLTYFQFEDNVFSLFPFVTGIFISQNEKLPLSGIMALARNLARIHSLSSNGAPSIDLRRLPEWDTASLLAAGEWFHRVAEQILLAIESTQNKTKFDLLAKESVELKLALARKIDRNGNIGFLGPHHLVHGDYHSQNVFFDDNFEVKHVFDFEKTDIRPRSLEVMRSMFLTCFNGNFAQKNFDTAKVFLKEYNRLYPLNSDELTAAFRYNYIKAVYGFWVEKEHYLLQNNRVDVFLERGHVSLKYFAENLDLFIDQIQSINEESKR